jgi:Arc/MetJ-type ribon-helix-helix transcriptional regulator
MTKETVRYPDEVVDAVEEVVEGGVFESKSEFYRFAAEYVLTTIRPAYDPQTIDFQEIRAEVHEHGGGGETGDFRDALLEVRRYGLREEYEDAEAAIDRRYDRDSVEGVLLDGVLAQYRRES